MDISLWKLIALVEALAPFVQAANLVKVTEAFGPNPTNAGFYIYVPDKLAASPPVLVNPHACHGDALGNFRYSEFPRSADKYGFIVIYPSSPHSSGCWDVSSPGTLSHNGTGGSGDSQGIVSMVRWTLNKYKGDSKRVFSMGVSSGAMMTNVLLGAYPDLFVAGSAWAGVPFGCFSAPRNVAYKQTIEYWNGDCAAGKVTHTAAEWKAMVQSAYPTYTGWRPKLQFFHGTADETLNYRNFAELVKQWTAVLGLDPTATKTTLNFLTPNWTRYTYGSQDWLWATSAGGVPHNIQANAAEALRWFDLTCTGANCFQWGKGGPMTQG